MHPGLWHSLLCLSILLCSTCGDPGVTPRFVSEPISTIQKPGSPVTLVCSVEPPWSQISWMFNGELLDRKHSEGVQIQAGQLNISSLSPQHVGRYQCMVNTSRGSIISTPAAVSVAYLGEFETFVKLAMTAEEGSSAVIVCNTPHSVPRAHLIYRIKGKWLDKSTDKYLILPSGNLHILNISLEDRGQYRCAAYNPVTHERRISSSVYKLSVSRLSEHESVAVQPVMAQSVSVNLHESLTLECADGGVPVHHFHWYKNGRDTLSDRRRALLHTHLVLDRVERSDAGNYSCALEIGPERLTWVNYTVTVLEAPYITRAPEDQSAPVGSDVSFICETQGNPSPNLTWLHNTAPVSPSLRLHPLGNKLYIRAIVPEDAGMYQCMADNGVGAVQFAARLHVQSEPSSQPAIVSPPENVSVVNGNWVTLTCNASGNPPPFIRWYDSKGPISSHPSQILRPKSLKASLPRLTSASGQDLAHVIMTQAGSSSMYISVVTMQHAGKYICEASNQFGSARAEAMLTVVPYEVSTTVSDIMTSPRVWNHADPIHSSPVPTDKPFNGAMLPDAPIILSPPLTTKPDMYFLAWRSGRDGGLPINAYFVRYRKLDDAGELAGPWNSVRVPASENEFPLTELEPSSLYEVLMVARNAAGEGQPAMLTFRTSKERRQSTKNTQAPSSPVGAPKQTPVHEGFNPNFRLVPPDPYRHSGVPEAPDRPTISTASETSVYVTWIPRANGGSPITSFKVEYKQPGRHWVTAADNIPPSKLSVEVSNLEPGAMYKFRVIAINNYGESQRSTASRPYQVAEYNSRLPNPLIVGPRIYHTEAVTDTQILLKWTYTPSNNNNTPIQGFYIYYRPTDSDNDSDYKSDMVEGVKQRHLISHLQPETAYDIKMQCFNERGASDYSNVMICETKARRSPGASDYPVLELSTSSTPDRGAGGSSSSSSTLARSGDMLYVIVGCVLGGMVLILMTFIAICLLKHRQQSLLHKFEPPGYLYHGSDLNGQMIEYTTLPGTNQITGNLHGGLIGNGTIPNGCPHVHHNLTSGVNGDVYPTCTKSLKGTCPDYEHLPHSTSNGGAVYTSVPQTDPSDCRNCRNCCNNNRCFSRTNGSLSTNSITSTSTTQDSQESKPLNHVSAPPPETESAPQPEEKAVQPLPYPSYHDETEEINDISHKGDSCCCSQEDIALPQASIILPSVTKNCDESKTWTLDNSANELRQQLPPQEV